MQVKFNSAIHLVHKICINTNLTIKTLIFQFPHAFKEFGAIDFLHFSPIKPYNLAATCSSKVNCRNNMHSNSIKSEHFVMYHALNVFQVQLYSSANNALHSSFTRFKQTAYGGVFRKDGKLLIAGSEDGFVRLFDPLSHKLLRIFKGHKA